MQVDTSVDEADIGRIQVGQRVTFTVDSFPAETFNGQVVQIRKAALVGPERRHLQRRRRGDNPGGQAPARA